MTLCYASYVPIPLVPPPSFLLQNGSKGSWVNLIDVKERVIKIQDILTYRIYSLLLQR